jgi:hypothetical protein
LASLSGSRSPGRRQSNSALVIALVLFVAAGLTLEFVFLPRASSPAVTTRPSEPVKTAVDQWVSYIGSRNVDELADLYAQNASVVWSGEDSGLGGTYVGQSNVKILYGATIGKDTSLNASIADYVQKYTSSTGANVTFTLDIKGNSTEAGAVAILVNASQEWKYAAGQWQIVKENWDYTAFDEQIAFCCVTTFPQWTALKDGQSPSLVSDKSFEWNAGPYVAASVYAFLGGVVALGLVRYRRGEDRSG